MLVVSMIIIIILIVILIVTITTSTTHHKLRRGRKKPAVKAHFPDGVPTTDKPTKSLNMISMMNILVVIIIT